MGKINKRNSSHFGLHFRQCGALAHHIACFVREAYSSAFVWAQTENWHSSVCERSTERTLTSARQSQSFSLEEDYKDICGLLI